MCFFFYCFHPLAGLMEFLSVGTVSCDMTEGALIVVIISHSGFLWSPRLGFLYSFTPFSSAEYLQVV